MIGTAAIQVLAFASASLIYNVDALSTVGLLGSQPGEADHSFQRGIELEKAGYARAASQAFHEAATMYQCFMDFDAGDEESNEFGHVTSLKSRGTSGDRVPSVLAYVTVRLAHLSHDAMGDSKAAARLYRDATQIDPLPSGVAYYGVGTSFEASKKVGDDADDNLDQAIEAYRQSYTISPNNYHTTFSLAVALERRGHTEESEKLMELLRRGGAISNCLVDSWGYVRWHTRKVGPSLNVHRGTRAMLEIGLNEARDLIEKADGLVCEFGVASGRSFRMTKEMLPLETAVHGFDTFTGIPQAWGKEPVGTYSTGGKIPRVEGKAFFYKGLFSKTIPSFLEEHDGPLAFANIDCDLYSSTYDILELLRNRIVPGTIIVFDEYLCYPSWREDEFRAWRECCKRFGWTYEYLAFSLVTKQAVLRVTSA